MSRVLKRPAKLIPPTSFVPPLPEDVLDVNSAAVPEGRIPLVVEVVEEELDEELLLQRLAGKGKGLSVYVVEEIPKVFPKSVNKEDVGLRTPSAEAVDSSRGGDTPAPSIVAGALPPSPGCRFRKKMQDLLEEVF
ncbi:hypothetical protein ACOSQ3_019029 [Xanthoceras sorbifolium]